MERGLHAIYVAQVGTVDEYRERVARSKPGYRRPKPTVLRTARDMFPNAPAHTTMSDAFRQAR